MKKVKKQNEKIILSKKIHKDLKLKKEIHFCKDCRFYDQSTQRKFSRKVGTFNEKTGERTELIEIRAVCRNPEAKSYQRLVMAEYSKRQCPVWKQGKYNSPKKTSDLKEKVKNNPLDQIDTEKMTSPEEYFGTPEERLKSS